MEEIEKIKFEIGKINKKNKPAKDFYVASNKLKTVVIDALKDLDINHNHSWAIEIFEKNKDDLDKVAIQYRGNKITYKKMFEEAYKYAKSLKKIGFNKNSEIPICVSNIPEFIYLFLAASFIGAKINVVADWFDENYLTEIFNNSNSDVIFVDDISYSNIKNSVENSKIKNIVMFSITDSLLRNHNGTPYNPYESIENKFHSFENKITYFKETSKKPINSVYEFINQGQNYNNDVFEEVDLDDDLTITYTSGTTTPGRPKGVIQSNRSYISLARFYEPDVSGMREMKNLKFLGHIATDTHIALSCGISDTLYCGCTYDCEPFYSKDFFPYSLLINKSNFVTASVGFWVYLSKLLNYDYEWKNIKMPFLMLPTVTGESCSPGEEKFLNYTSRKHKFGTEKLPYPLSPVSFSIGGGTTEGTGIFVTLFKSLQEKLPNNIIKKGGLGLTPLPLAEIEVLNSNLEYCKIGEPGLLVEKSPCIMKGYVDKNLDKKAFIKDKYGKEWLSLGTYSYKSDKYGRIKMKGRMNDNVLLSTNQMFPLYLIEESILKDTKNIMSCSLVNVDNCYICHVEFQPVINKNQNLIIKSLYERIKADIPTEILENLYIRVRDFNESYPLDPSGKRSLSQLKQEGLTEKCISFSEMEKKYRIDSKQKVLIKK